jgi:TPR repeat protein
MKPLINSAAEAGYPAALVIKGTAEIESDAPHARDLLQSAEAAGDVTAATALGSLYWSGANGVTQDHHAALAAWLRAAKAGDPYADLGLAQLYLTGGDPPADLSKAFFYYALAAKAFGWLGDDAAKRDQVYRRAALAYLLPMPEVSRLMQLVERWQIGADLP